MHNTTEHENRVKERVKRLLQRHREHTEPYLQPFCGETFEILPSVFNPAYGEGATLLVENMNVREGENVLEIGTGSGVVGIIAAHKAEKVVLIDISDVAVKCARRNVERAQLQNKIDVRQGNLFEPLKSNERFSLILFNPPFMFGKPKGILETAIYDENYNTFTNFLADVGSWLTEDGRTLIVFSSVGDMLYFGGQVAKHGLCHKLLEKIVVNEIIFCVYELWL
jgi:release factor glutamine methyltransferase